MSKECTKKAYSSQQEAEFFLVRMHRLNDNRSSTKRKEKRAYKCPKCLHWHLSSMPYKVIEFETKNKTYLKLCEIDIELNQLKLKFGSIHSKIKNNAIQEKNIFYYLQLKNKYKKMINLLIELEGELNEQQIKRKKEARK